MRRMGMKFFGLIALCGLVSVASAAPIPYTFTSGRLLGASGSGVGLLSATDSVAGSFLYNPEGPSVGAGTFGTSAGVTYYSVDEFHATVGGRTFYDQRAGSEVANEFPPGGSDVFTLVGSPFGGDWNAFEIGGVHLLGFRIHWIENGISRPDFLASDELLPTLPMTEAVLNLFFGTADGVRTGQIDFAPTFVHRVPEPTTLSILLLGLAGLAVRAAMRSKYEALG